MRKSTLAIATTATLIVAAALVPGRADAMTFGTAAGLNAAVVDGNLVEDVAYVCRHRGYSSRRVCWWVPTYRYRYRYWRYRRW